MYSASSNFFALRLTKSASKRENVTNKLKELYLSNQNQRTLSRHLKWTVLSAGCGVLAGVSSTLFLLALQWTTDYREAHSTIIWGLPLAGLFISWLYHNHGKDIATGNNLIIDEIHDPKKVVPFRMAPFILGSTILTQLFGGSAGREGTAVQMGASLSDQLAHIFKIEAVERKILLTAGAGAGFGAAIGAPWAGVIFGMEVIHVGRFKPFALVECLIASFVGYYTALALHAPHSVYPKVTVPAVDIKILFFVLVAGFVFGLAARFFTATTHLYERTLSHFVKQPILRPVVGGILVVIMYKLEGSYRYVGLGIQYIQEALTQPETWKAPLLKSFFTTLTIGSGFKGGEFIPLVYIGTTLGSALSLLLPVSFDLLAALGFAAVFGAAANTPISCTLMAMEIFGYQITPYALIACFAAYAVSGRSGIYKSQKKIKAIHKQHEAKS